MNNTNNMNNGNNYYVNNSLQQEDDMETAQLASEHHELQNRIRILTAQKPAIEKQIRDNKALMGLLVHCLDELGTKWVI